MKKLITLTLLLITINVLSQDIKFGKISKEELNEKFYPLDSTANAAYLYKARRTFCDYNETDGFVLNTEVHERIKIYNKKGLNYANKLVSYYKPESGDEEKVYGIKGYTFNIENGNIQEEKLSSKQVFDEKNTKYWSRKKIAMPAVKVGSVLDIKYKIKSPYYTHIPSVQFQFGIPVKKYKTLIRVPEYFDFRKNVKGYYLMNPKSSSSSQSINFINKNTNTNGSTNYRTSKIDYQRLEDTYEAINVPALKDNEPFVSNISNYRGGVSYEIASIKYPNSIRENYTKTWEGVSKSISQSPNFGGELEKKGYFKSDLAELLAGKNTEYEKLAAVFQFVKSKVKWNGYFGKYTDNGVRKAYKEGVGNIADINLMLTAMLRESGLNSSPVLVSSKDHGIPLFPTRRGFNYVISMVEFSDGKYVLLDATEPLSIPGLLPERAMNWNGRRILRKGNSSWVPLKPLKHSIEENKVYLNITNEKTVEGLHRTTYKNSKALKYRIANNNLSEDDLIVKLEEKHGIEISDFKVLNGNNLGKPIVRNIKLTKEDAIEEINDKLYINPLLYLAETENPFKSEERNFPVDFGTRWEEKNLVSMTIPEGYKISFIPENTAIGLKDNIGVFKFIIKQSGKNVTVQSILKFNESLITPQYYEDLKGFFNEVVLKQSEKIILEKE